MAGRVHAARALTLLVCLGSAVAWRPALQLGSQWPAWKLLVDAAAETKDDQLLAPRQDYTPDAEVDKVDALPGFGHNGKLPFELYAGWVIHETGSQTSAIRCTNTEKAFLYRLKMMGQWLRCRYITVNKDAGRALYYTFAESQTNAAEHPLVLWLNG